MDEMLCKLNDALSDAYNIEEYIDKGGQARVFRGFHDGREIALKIYSLDTNPKRVEAEVSFLKRIDHPNLVKIFASETVVLDGAQYCAVAYEFVSNGGLVDYLSPSSGGIPLDEACKLGAQMGSALEFIWKYRKVHRDIKPGNILINDDNDYVLVDFGYARHLDLTSMTCPGGNPGTPGYKSPEQQLGRRNLTIRSDVFSLGITIFEVLANVHPFERRQQNIGSKEPLNLLDYRPDATANMVNLINNMLSAKVSKRPIEISTAFRDIMEN